MMSVCLVAEESMKRGLCLFSRRLATWHECGSPWQQLRSPWQHLKSPWQQHGRFSQGQVGLMSSSVNPVKFYSEERRKAGKVLDTEDTPGGTPQRELPPFIQELQVCRSPSDVLDLTCKYSPTPRQVNSCLAKMWITTKAMSEEQKRLEMQLMLAHPALDRLLQSAMNNVAHMRLLDLPYCLLSVVKLGIPHQSRVVQTLLRACQERLNDFDEKGLSILASSLENLEDTPNVVSLRMGMKLTVEARLPSIKDVVALQTMMRALGKDAPMHLKRKLEAKALSMADQFTPPNTQFMISTMAAVGFSSKPLLEICSKKIIENLHGIPFNRLLTVMKSFRVLFYRDSKLLTDISDYIASTIDVWSTKQLILFLDTFEDLSFSPDAIMELFAQKVISSPDSLTLKDLRCILKVYSSLNYDLRQQREQFLDTLSQALASYLSRMSRYDLLKTVYHLCLLGHFPPALLEPLLESSTLEQFRTAASPAPHLLHSQEKFFQTVDLCLRLDRPALPRPLTVPSFVLGEPDTTGAPPPSTWLSQSLRSALGEQADAMMQETVLVENCYLIDAVVTRPQQDRGPSAPDASSDTAGACSPAESSQRIAVLWGPHSSCYGTSRPRGPMAVKTRHLKILGYDRVLVIEQEHQFMSELDRTDFLRRQIYPERHTSETQTAPVQAGSREETLPAP